MEAKARTLVPIGHHLVGGENPILIAGPCAVESGESFLRIARACKDAGAHGLRGGAFKPRADPSCFRGLDEEGLKIMALARDQFSLPICIEVLNPRDVELVARYADVLQIGSCNMQDYALLTEAGQTGLPVLLKRGLGATVLEWLQAAEYVLATGNNRIILCERGIRTFEPSTRYTLDVAAVPVILQESQLPVIIDPSDAAGNFHLVAALGRAGIAAGAHGLIIEVHDNVGAAACDGVQIFLHEDLRTLAIIISHIALALRETPTSMGKRNERT